jgi:hypothetical protein
MSEQIDIAVDLGVVPPPLPRVLSLNDLVRKAPQTPPQVIEGVLHQGCKMILGGHEQEQQELVPARPGGERGYGEAVFEAAARGGTYLRFGWVVLGRHAGRFG